MLLSKEDIHKILPQKSPFILVDNLLEWTTSGVKTNYSISNKGALFYNNQFCEEGILENIAQTTATYLGYEAYINKKPVPVGFIAAVKDFTCNKFLKENDLITTEVIYKNLVLNIHVVDAFVYHNNELIANAELRIYIDGK